MNKTDSSNDPDPQFLLESLNDGVYATDRDRKIVYWSSSAERITGWRQKDILGKRCADDVLCHVDKDGRPLCSTETCPLHRAIVTGNGSKVPIIVFAKCSDGHRIPMRVSVAPVRNSLGEVVGGVETFCEVSEELQDAQLAKRIQTSMLSKELPQDKRASFAVRYLPLDMIGGDYYAMSRVNPDQVAFILADVSGHGLAAALYTVHLDALWRNHTDLQAYPGALASVMTRKLAAIIGDEPSFATGMLGLIDLREMQLTLASAGGPWPFMFHKDGTLDVLEGSGLPLGCSAGNDEYQQRTYSLSPGDCLLAFTDGAMEIHKSSGKLLGSEGLEKVLKEVGYPTSPNFDAIAERLLVSSDRIRFDDDLTFMEVRISDE